MQATITRNAIVQTGHRIELITPELPEGTKVQITVTIPAPAPSPELQSRFCAPSMAIPMTQSPNDPTTYSPCWL